MKKALLSLFAVMLLSASISTQNMTNQILAIVEDDVVFIGNANIEPSIVVAIVEDEVVL